MISTLVLSDEPSQFHDLNVLLIEALEAGIPTVMVDMPEILLRMKIANEYTLKDLEKIFNKVCGKIKRGECRPIPALVAAELYPEIFVRPREEYVYQALKEICDEQEQDEEISILTYLGDVHVSPIE